MPVPNHAPERTGQQLRCWLPSSLRSSVAAQRSVSHYPKPKSLEQVFWGDPTAHVERAHAAGVKVVHQVGSVREAAWGMRVEATSRFASICRVSLASVSDRCASLGARTKCYERGDTFVTQEPKDALVDGS